MDFNLLLVLVIVCLLVTNSVSLYYVYKFGKIILNFEDSVEDALDDLDTIHEEISQVLETPLFYDSPEVRKVITQIEKARNIIVNSADKTAKIFNQIDSEPENLNEDQKEKLAPINSSVVDQLFERQNR